MTARTTNKTTSPSSWQGRIDTEETGPSTRWHQRVTPFDATTQGGIALIGFAVDEGVQRNGGRPGAALGPKAIRGALANLPVLNEPAITDAGDVVCDKAEVRAEVETETDDGLEAAQTRLAQRVAQVRAQKAFPVVLGGGHEVAWGTFQGLVQSGLLTPGFKLLIVNLDAHFDLRVAARCNSGTPFRQMQEWCVANGLPFNYRVLGISAFANTQALFDRAKAFGVRYWLDEDLQTEAGCQAAMAVLSGDLHGCDAVYLTVCLDVLPAAVAPGVSAPALLGVPLGFVERMVDQIALSGRLVAADIAEMNPTMDRDGLTARVAARLVGRIARGLGMMTTLKPSQPEPPTPQPSPVRSIPPSAP